MVQFQELDLFSLHLFNGLEYILYSLSVDRLLFALLCRIEPKGLVEHRAV